MQEPGSHREREAKFVIVASEPDAVAATIADLERLGGFILLSGDSRDIVDVYFDSAARELTARHWALRVRCAEESTILLTLKGPSGPTDWGGVERLEIEAPWTKKVLERVAEEMTRAGIFVLEAGAFYEDDAIETLEHRGLEVIQRRNLWRRTRQVISEDSGTTVAELAIDQVCYRGALGKIFHWEVEIEAFCGSQPDAIPQIITALLDPFSTVFRPWPHSKLATGRAIDDLSKKGLLRSFLRKDLGLTPAAYVSLDKHLQEST